jgi:hypothetical protein
MTVTVMNAYALVAEKKMFLRHEYSILSNPVCLNTAKNLKPQDFQYYDKDGFELNQAEQKFYSAMDYPIDYPCLNHTCWQRPWFYLKTPATHTLILDHSIILQRCSYDGKAAEQLTKLKDKIPYADLLLKTKQKWGFDFALDSVADDGTVFEVIHIEYDNYDFDIFKNQLIMFEYSVRHIDWIDAAARIWNHRDDWQRLTGLEQNHWKAKYLLDWDRAEYTEKSV